MSVCKFIASDIPLAEVAPLQEYPVKIDIDKGTIDDGDADNNYFLILFDSVKQYTDKKYGVCLEWRYTEGRAKEKISEIWRCRQSGKSKGYLIV